MCNLSNLLVGIGMLNIPRVMHCCCKGKGYYTKSPIHCSVSMKSKTRTRSFKGASIEDGTLYTTLYVLVSGKNFKNSQQLTIKYTKTKLDIWWLSNNNKCSLDVNFG